jgi:hypothetical protein
LRVLLKDKVRANSSEELEKNQAWIFWYFLTVAWTYV